MSFLRTASFGWCYLQIAMVKSMETLTIFWAKHENFKAFEQPLNQLRFRPNWCHSTRNEPENLVNFVHLYFSKKVVF